MHPLPSHPLSLSLPLSLALRTLPGSIGELGGDIWDGSYTAGMPEKRQPTAKKCQSVGYWPRWKLAAGPQGLASPSR